MKQMKHPYRWFLLKESNQEFQAAKIKQLEKIYVSGDVALAFLCTTESWNEADLNMPVQLDTRKSARNMLKTKMDIPTSANFSISESTVVKQNKALSFCGSPILRVL